MSVEYLKNTQSLKGNIMETIINVKTNGEFTQEHLETVKLFLRKEAFPQFYTNVEFKSLKFDDVYLINASSIDRKPNGRQAIRSSGNPEYEKLKADILENGFRLYEKPIFVKRVGSKFEFLDGRTKDKILSEKKFKNRICVVVSIDESEQEEYGERLNAGEDSSPAGLVTELDLIHLAQKKIQKQEIELDPDEILKWINKCCGRGKFSATKRAEIAFKLFHQQNAVMNSGLEPNAWANKYDVVSWLEGNKYIETPTVVYLPYASSSPIKAFHAAAQLSQQKPNKEIRLVIYVSKLNGYDLKKCYINSILKFKSYWYNMIDLIGHTYYSGAKPQNINVKLYGCVPSNIDDICVDTGDLIIFGKNDQKINDNYLSNQGLSSFFDMDEEDGEL